MNRKGLFFTIDAIIALIVLTIGVVTVFVIFTGQPLREQTALYANDLMGFFHNTRVQDIREGWLVNLWCDQGPECTMPTHNLTSPQQTLLATFAQLISEDRTSFAQFIARNLSIGLVQQQFSWNMSIVDPNGRDTLLVDHTQTIRVTNLIATKSIVYFVNANHSLEGPYVAQIDVWQ